MPLHVVFGNGSRQRGEARDRAGAGTGVVGIGADVLLGQCGTGEEDTGHSIIVTDLAEAVELMAENIRLNGATRCSAAELAWGVTDVGSAFDAPFDVVLMAEVAYLPETYSALAATVAALSGPQTVVLHGYTPRDACRSDLLFAELSAHGFSHEELVGSSAVQDPHLAGSRIYLHRPPQEGARPG